jgi:undecaprenyl-diphosphatase
MSLVRHHAWRLLLLYTGVLLPLVIFGKLASQVRHRTSWPADEQFLLWLHQWATPGIDYWVALGTMVGGILAIPSVVVLLWSLRRLQNAVLATFIGMAVSGAWLLTMGAKLCFGRERPHLWPSPTPEHDPSFPSGHAMLSMTIALICLLVAWPTRWRWPVVALAVLGVPLVGLSRLYLGVHFPTDIIGGWCAAILWIFGLLTVFRRSNLDVKWNTITNET